MEMTGPVDVLIVGYGPVGKLLAIQLGQRGHEVLVVDRNQTAYPLPRAVTHDADFARVLQSVGLAPDTIPGITEAYDDLYLWRSRDGRTLMEIDWSGYGESGWYNTYFFHQPALEDVLDRAITALPSVRVARGWEGVDLEQDEGSVSTTLREVASGRRATVGASWVVGADGANSWVRRRTGLEWHDQGYFHDWLVVDVTPRPGADLPRVAVQTCDPARPTTTVPGGPGRRRWEFMRLPGESREELDRAESAWALLAPHGATPDNAVLGRHSVYTFQACWATRWQEGRVLLAGDAAHLMPPFAGQGLGAGVRDAMNLSWKLDAVLRGVADEDLVATYGPERIHHAVTFVRFSSELGKIVCTTDPAEAAERDAGMIARLRQGRPPPAPPRPGLGPGLHVGAHGGALARQGRVVAAGGAPRLLDDVLGGPGALLARSSASLEGLDGPTRKALDDLGVRLVALTGPPVTSTQVVDDVEGTYATWLDQLGVDVVLIRPDFHLYGCADHQGGAQLAEGFLAQAGARRFSRR